MATQTTSDLTLRLLDADDCAYLGGALDLAGGRILNTPVTYWRGGGWDLQSYSSQRIAICPVGGVGADVGRPLTPAMVRALRAALEAYRDDDEPHRDLATLAEYGL